MLIKIGLDEYTVTLQQWTSQELHFKGSPCFTRILILFSLLKS
jgi:hypothetical protein